MTPQQPLEMILLRQMASYLAIAMWMMDSSGDLIYYNEPAEELLGVRFDDVGPIRADQLVGMWQVTDQEGNGWPTPTSRL
jgi:PAS domain-containing protein